MAVIRATVDKLLVLTGETIQCRVTHAGLVWYINTGVVATVDAISCTTGESIQALSIDSSDPDNVIVTWGVNDSITATVGAFLCTTSETIQANIDGVLQWETVWQESYLYIPGSPEYLLELTAYVPGTGEVIKYYSTKGTVYEGIYYEPRILQPGNFQQMLFADGTTSGQSQTGFGEIVLINSDGGLDDFDNYGLDGRTAVLRKLVDGTAAIVMNYCMEQLVSTWDSVHIRVKDKQQLFNVPIQPTKYSGDNVLPDGEEGAAGIQGTPKPLTFGQVSNVTPICVNTFRLIYQLHESALHDISAVYDKGVSLTRGADYASLTDMQTNAPAAGAYRAYLAGGMFRLGSSPFGVVTCDATEGTTAADRTAAQITKRIALRGISIDKIDAADIATLDSKNSAVIGIYINRESTIAVALDEVINSVGGWYSFDSLGVIHMGRLEVPGDPIITLTRTEIKSMERQATNDEGRGVPPYKVNLNYSKNYTVQDAASLAWSVEVDETGTIRGIGTGSGTVVDNSLLSTVIAGAIAAAADAQTAANSAASDAAAAVAAIANISSDSILSPGEKSAVLLDYSNITSEQAGIDSQASALSITTEKTAYDTAVTALMTYLSTLSGWNTIPGTDVTIVGTTFRTKFAAVYSARQTLLNKIAAVIKADADYAATTATDLMRSGDASKIDGRLISQIDAYVDTLQIKNRAVIAPTYATFATQYLTSSDASPYNLTALTAISLNGATNDAYITGFLKVFGSSVTADVSFSILYNTTGSSTVGTVISPTNSTAHMTTSNTEIIPISVIIPSLGSGTYYFFPRIERTVLGDLGLTGNCILQGAKSA
jgi:hypothetical protein